MSRSAKCDLPWADGMKTFRLPIAQLEELQEKCDAGPNTIYQRLSMGTWLFQDVRETIRLGLIGGGAKSHEALTLVMRYVDPPVPLLDNVHIAKAILAAALVGSEDEPVGKGHATKGRATRKSPSPRSTGSAARAATTQRKSET